MIGRFGPKARALALGLLPALALLSTGCDALGGPQNTFSPGGDVAEMQRDLFLLTMWIALAIMILVFAAAIYIMIRFRRRSNDPIPKQVHGNTRLELGWTIAPTILLAIIAVPTVLGIIELGEGVGADGLRVGVDASQFSWQFSYLNPEYATEDGEPFSTNQCPESVDEPSCLYIPTGRDVGYDVESFDVIHSFWVPKLAGKQDAIPGRTNHLWFNATEPGVFHGQCAEFCGTGHPGMRLAVIALEPEAFDTCIRALMAEEEQPAACVPPEETVSS
jgi:cytochrome c oxidase subunit 2